MNKDEFRLNQDGHYEIHPSSFRLPPFFLFLLAAHRSRADNVSGESHPHYCARDRERTMSKPDRNRGGLSRLLDQFFHSPCTTISFSTRTWSPPTDVFESACKAVIRMELAGVQAEGLEITAEGNRLSVRGRRSPPKEATGSIRHHQLEIQYGRFHRVFEFPFDVNMDDVTATFEAGFLHIELPKTADCREPIAIAIVSDEHITQH